MSRPALRKLNARVPRDLETICLKCLEKDPARRYPTAREFADELRRFLSNEPICARPIGRLKRAWRWCERKPIVAGLSAAVVLSLLAGILVSSCFAVSNAANAAEARTQANAAIRARDAAKAATKQALANLAETSYQAARLAGERGKWELALEQYNQALELGNSDPVKVRLGKIGAFGALQQLDNWSAEIAALSNVEGIAAHRGELMFLQSQRLRFIGQDQQGFDLMERALRETDLAPADREYILAVLADTVPKSTEHFELALKADPFHRRAKSDYTGLLIFQGRLAEAKNQAMSGTLLFPEDPGFAFYMAVIAAFQGDREGITPWVNSSVIQMRPVERSQILAVTDALLDVQAMLEKDWEDVDLMDALKLLPHVSKVFALSHEARDSQGMMVFAFVPRSLQRSLKCIRQAFDPDGLTRDPMGALSNPIALFRMLTHRPSTEQMQQVVAIDPDGSFLTILGMCLLADNRWEEAAKVAKQAMETPGLIPGFQRESYSCAACVAGMRFGKTGDCAELDRALNYLQARKQRGKLNAALLKLGFICARKRKNFDLAREYMSEARKAAPSDLSLMADQAEFEIEARGYLTALRIAKAGLATDPSNQRFASLRHCP